MAAAARVSGGRKCRRKTHRPPGADAKAAAAQLGAFDDDGYDGFAVDLGAYARAVDVTDPCGCAGGWGPSVVTDRGGDRR